MSDLSPVFAGILEALGRPILKAHREFINRTGHFRRTKAGALAWVEPHQVLAHIAEHGPEPTEPTNTGHSVKMGAEAMEKAIEGHNVVHAMHRKGLGWIDFTQGNEREGIIHIRQKRDEEHAQNARRPDGMTTLKMLPAVIAKGRIFSGSVESAKLGIELDGVRVLLAKSGPDRWLLTGFQRG